MTVFVLAMGWWLAALAAPPSLTLPMSWLHAWLLCFGTMGPFIAGFLFTAYSRWLNAAPPARACWMSALASMAVGTALFFVGALFNPRWSLLGAVTWLAAWVLVFGHLLRAARQGGGAALHSGAMMVSVAFGLAAAALLAGWLATGNSALATGGLAVMFWGYLMGVYLVVAHRMIPFFASRALTPYVSYRPSWALWLALALTWAHLGFELAARPRLLWLTDLPLAVLAGWLAWRWQWWRSGANRLLAGLFVAWFGLVGGLVASAAVHGYLYLAGRWIGFHLPEHLIGIGFFGAMIIAMGTRVTLGHSGRPLRMGRTAWWALLCISLAAGLRALADILPLRDPLIFASAALWTVAGLAWMWRHAPMLLGPRVDRRPG